MAVANLVKLPRIQTFWHTTANALECEEVLTVQRTFNFAIPADGAIIFRDLVGNLEAVSASSAD